MPTYTGVYRKGKKWYGAKWYKGKTYVTKLCITAEEASYFRGKLIKRFEKGLDVDKSKITVERFISIYLEKYLYKKTNLQDITLKETERHFRNSIIPIIGNKKLRNLTPEDLQDLQNSLLAKYKPSSARLILSQFKRVLKRAAIWHYIEYNPSMGLDTIDVDIPTTIEDITNVTPRIFNLSQNYPNPFNPSTKIKYSLPKTENVKIEVYNLIGQKIETLLNKSMPAGYHEVEFNGQNLSSGVYLYRIEVLDPARRTGAWQDVRKMLLVK